MKQAQSPQGLDQNPARRERPDDEVAELPPRGLVRLADVAHSNIALSSPIAGGTAMSAELEDELICPAALDLAGGHIGTRSQRPPDGVAALGAFARPAE